MHTGAGEGYPDSSLPAAGKTDADAQGQTHSPLVQERCHTQTFIPGETGAEFTTQESELQQMMTNRWTMSHFQ